MPESRQIHAKSTEHAKHKPDPVSGLFWGCMFPIYVIGVLVGFYFIFRYFY